MSADKESNNFKPYGAFIASHKEQTSNPTAMCLIALLGLLAPRIVLILLWVFNSGFVNGPFDNVLIWPILGLFLLPTTTLAYCLAYSLAGGVQSFSGIFLLAVGLLVDLGAFGSGRGLAKR